MAANIDNQSGVSDNAGPSLTFLNNLVTAAQSNQTTPQNGANDLNNNKDSASIMVRAANEKQRLAGGKGPQGTNASSMTAQNPNVGAFYGV